MGESGELLVPVDGQAEKLAEGRVGAKMGEEALKLTESLFAVEMAKTEAAVPFGCVGDSSGEVAIETHAI